MLPLGKSLSFLIYSPLIRRLSSVYEVIPTNISLQPFALGGFTSKGEETVLSKLAECDVVLIGEHHDSQKDHDLQARKFAPQKRC